MTNYSNLLFFDKKGDPFIFEWTGTHWEGSILFDRISTGLFDVAHIFIVEKLLDLNGQEAYGFPHESTMSPSVALWQTNWTQDPEDRADYSNAIYLYTLTQDPNLDSPVLVKQDQISITPDTDPNEVFIIPSPGTGSPLRQTSVVNSNALQINVVLNSQEEGVFERILELRNDPTGTNDLILKITCYGETVGEDDRLKSILDNFGRAFNKEDELLTRESDINEDLPDWITINRKRKELVLQGEQIYPYIGSFRGLVNAIKFFGYEDMRIKEYWLNMKYAEDLPAIQQNALYLQNNTISSRQTNLIRNILGSENAGKYTLVETYGLKSDGTYGIKVPKIAQGLNTSYKKTALFGLFYDINEATNNEDSFGYPIIRNDSLFSPEEVLVKLFGLKEKLKRSFLPINAKILDITGEGVYFSVHKKRYWNQELQELKVESGNYIDFEVTPTTGYVEDLRYFSLRGPQNGLLYPVVNNLQTQYTISPFGNTVLPYTNSQDYSPGEVQDLIPAIEQFYQEYQAGTIFKYLGDGDYTTGSTFRRENGSDYYIPAGCPVILQNRTAALTYNDLDFTYDSVSDTYASVSVTGASFGDLGVGLNDPTSFSALSPVTIPTSIPTQVTVNILTGISYLTPPSGTVAFIRVEYDENNRFFGTIGPSSYNSLTGDLTISVRSFKGTGTYSSGATVSLVNIYSTRRNYQLVDLNSISFGGYYSWDNLEYLDFQDIEWTITKTTAPTYNFSISGPIRQYARLPHFLPYAGKYTVKCRIWDSFNTISFGYKTDVIEVLSREVNLLALTRFREHESYGMGYIKKGAAEYDSNWVVPFENEENADSSQLVPHMPFYGNNFGEGQNYEVLKDFPAIRATGGFQISVTEYDIASVASPTGPSGGFLLARVTTTLPHGFSNGDLVSISDPLSRITGRFTISNVGPTGFDIPRVISTPLVGATLTARGPGGITLSINNSVVGATDMTFDLGSTSSQLFVNTNNSPVLPRYNITSVGISGPTATFVIQAPFNTGADYNGRIITINATGSILANTGSFALTGGANPVSRYVPYNYSGEYPTYNSRYLGTKRLSIDTFEDSENDSFYAHTYDMYDYHNDWLGGFDIYFPKYGDRIRVGKNTTGHAFGETDSPANGYLDLREACDQLNASNDRGISLFTYEVRNYSQLPQNFSGTGNTISPDLGTSEGPVNEEFTFTNLPYATPLPTSIARDLNGDIFIAGYDLYAFNGSTGGTGFKVYNTTNSLLTGTNTLSIHIDVEGDRWVGMENSSTPLIKLNRTNPQTGRVYTWTDFVDNSGNPVITPSGSIRVIKTNSTNGDILCYFDGGSASPGDDGLLYYSGATKSWKLYTTANSEIPSTTIRDIVIEYLPKRKWKAWICTNAGLVEFNGAGFRTFDITNSGLPNNDVYSLDIDILKNKWITTANNIAYWDHERWTVWNPNTNPELPTGVYHNLVHTEHGNVWFVITTGGSPGTNELVYFNGYTFKFYASRVPSSPGIPIEAGTNTFHAPCLLYAKWKTLKNGVFQYPNNLWFITGNNEICQLDYLVPHIHASAKYPGTLGWQFVYPESSLPLPSLRTLSDYRSGTGNFPQNFYLNASPSIIYSNISLNSGLFRPQMPHVDRYSWVKPTWQNYSLDFIQKQFPHINPDHLFLYTDLRDVIDGKAEFEDYWRNSGIERYEPGKSRKLFNNFEWVITMGDTSNDQGIKTAVDPEGYVYMTGFYRDTITLGEVNNVTLSVSLTSSSGGADINTFLAKYNQAGVLQWARNIGPSNVSPALGVNYFPNSLITDTQGNVYVVGYSEGAVSPVPTREGYLVKWDSGGNLINSATTIVSSPGQTEVTDVKVDPSGNVYFTGIFNGTCAFGPISLTAQSTGGNGFLAKLSAQGQFSWVQGVLSSGTCKTYELAFTEAYEPLVVSVSDANVFIGSTTIPVAVNSPGSALVYTTHSNTTGEPRNYAVLEGANSSFLPPSITYKNGHAYVTGGFAGSATIQNRNINASGASDIFFMKINTTGKVELIKRVGGTLGDAATDIEIDSDENIYVLGYFAGSLMISPNVYSPKGGSDLILMKWTPTGDLIDVVIAGGILTDQGADLALDRNDNIYVTGYYEGSTAEFPPYFVQSPAFGQQDIFLGKIPANSFKPGKAYGEIISWLGSHSWSWNDKRVYDKNFEIPVNTTVFFNPIDSYIPGKKNHVWSLYNEDTGEKLIQVRGENSLIWTFVSTGNYSVSLSMEDSNGNQIEVYKKGLVRVINHKKPDPQDLVPEIVDADDFKIRSFFV